MCFGSLSMTDVALITECDVISASAHIFDLAGTNTLLIPRVFTVGNVSDSTPSMGSYIVMEYLDIKRGYDPAKLGRELARMHLAEPSDPNARAGMYGFAVDNTIGGTPQPNGWSDNWVDFFRERRLRHQLKLTGDPQLMQLGGELCDNLEYFFDGVQVRPSIIHGDLWSGNIGSVGGQPAIFDPATYYGHHEAEFGMSWCSGFSNAFYTAYHELIPKAQGWESRHDIYTLYHYLNHYNLFGYGYYQQCIETLRRLLRRL